MNAECVFLRNERTKKEYNLQVTGKNHSIHSYFGFLFTADFFMLL